MFLNNVERVNSPLYYYYNVDNNIKFDFKKVRPVDLNLDYIYKRLTQKQILEHFLDDTIEFKKFILSPLRKENNPSFSFKLTPKNDIIWTDWGTGETGDTIKFIEKLYGCNHQKALEIIYDKLLNEKNELYIISDNSLRSSQVSDSENYRRTTRRSSIIIKDQLFTAADKSYWNSYNISLQTLVKYDVYSVKYLWYEGNLIKTYSSNNPIYAYKFTYDGNTTYKIYMPFEAKSKKWLSNTTKRDIQGYSQLPEKDTLLIITKSLKDVMVLNELGYSAIAPQAESINVEEKFIDKLYNRFDNIIVFYDNDITGMYQAKKLKKQHNLPNIQIPKEIYNVKDISDFCKKYGIYETREFLKKLLTI